MLLERRHVDRDRRQDGRVLAVFAVRNVIGTRPQLGQAEDIGPSGITLRRPRELPVPLHTPLSLSFELPGTRSSIDVKGLVVSDQRSGHFRRTGIRFTEVSREIAERLAEFCLQRGESL